MHGICAHLSENTWSPCTIDSCILSLGNLGYGFKLPEMKLSFAVRFDPYE